jgi:hypothetical protein
LSWAKIDRVDEMNIYCGRPIGYVHDRFGGHDSNFDVDVTGFLDVLDD